MTIEEFRNEFIKRIRFEAEHNGTSPDEQFISTAIENLEDLGEFTDPYPMSCYIRGKHNRIMAFDCYGYDEADNSIVMLISDFKNSDEPTTLTNSRIDELCKQMSNFIDEAYNGNMSQYCDDSDEAIDIAKQFKDRMGKSDYDNEVFRFKFIIVTNATLSNQVKNISKEDFLGRKVELNIWTLERFFNAYLSNNSESIEINCSDFNVSGLQCLKANISNTDYDAYLSIVPGKFIADIYIKYGSRLLQGNIRAFLGIRGKKNKGIRETILKEPNRFFTYNNGIAVVARSIKLSDDKTKITSFSDFQIINGGQTTASLAAALLSRDYKDDLKDIFVPMKLTVLNVEDEMSSEDIDKYNTITQQISRCANTQNNVSDADFFSNHPFHIQMEELSKKTPAPPVNGNPYQTIWFYERSKCKYEQEQFKLTESQRNKFKEKFPKNQVIKKEKLAKCLNAIWGTPHSVIQSSGASIKVFSAQIEKLIDNSKDNINEEFFKRSVCSVILFDTIDKLIGKADWYPKGGNKAEIIPYALAKLFTLIPDKYSIDWRAIWQKQQVYPALYNQLEIIAYQTFLFLEDTNGIKAREYAKRAENWKKFKDAYPIKLLDEFIASLIPMEVQKEEEKSARRSHKFNSDIDASVQIYNYGYLNWMKVYNELNENRLISSGNCDFIKSIAGYIERGSLPTPAQIKKLIKIIHAAEDAGYILP